MKIIPKLRQADGDGYRAGLLEDFLDSSSDEEGSFAWGDGEIIETTTEKCGEEGHVNAPFSSAELTVTRSNSQHSLTSGIVGNLRSSLMKAKQASVRQLQKQCSKRSLFSAASSSHHGLADDSGEMDVCHVGELLNREILVKEQEAVKLENDDFDFVRDVAYLKTKLERQNSEKMHVKTKKEQSESTLTSRSHHMCMRKDETPRTDKSNIPCQPVQIGDFSAVHIKASAGFIAGGGRPRARRGRGHIDRTNSRRRLTRSKSDPSDIEKMVHGSLAAKDRVGKTSDLTDGTDLPRGRRTVRRHQSANDQDLLEMLRDNQTQVNCESSQISNLTSDLDLDGVTKEKSSTSSRMVPLSIACDSKKSCERRSSFSTSPTEVNLSETSDTEEDKSAPLPSESESSQKVSTGREGKIHLEYPRRIRSTDRTPFVHPTTSKSKEAVELPYCSSHKSTKAAQCGHDEETFVFQIDEDLPFVRSKHRGMKEFIQLNISNRSLAS